MTRKKKGLLEKIINIILNVLIGIFGFLLLVTIYNNIQTKLLGNSYSSFFGYSLFEVQTGSMADTINAGDWIIVKYQRTINLNDIITYEHKGDFITHRVVEVYKETFVTKGDFNNAKDEPINKKQVVGKVIKILPNFGILRKTLLNPMVLLTLIITLYFAMAVYKSKYSVRDDDLEEKEMVRGFEVVMGSLISKLKSMINKFSADRDNSVVEKVNVKPEVQQKVEDRFLEQEVEEPVKESEVVQEKMSEEDLDKTMYFRMVSVDQEEIENAYSDISYEEDPEDEVVSKLVTDEPTKKREKKEKSDSEALKELELLQKRKKKFKNILDKVIYIKSEEVSEIVEILNQREKSKTNEATIKKTFLKAYIDGKYYNYCGDVNTEYNGKNMTSKMSLVISEVANRLIQDYQQNDVKFTEKVQKYERLFTLTLYLEQAFLISEELQDKKDNYQSKIFKFLGRGYYTDAMLKNVIQDVIKTQKKYQSMIKYSFEKLDTSMFELNLDTAISKVKKIYAVELKHNIAFSKVYSDYIVDKTYKEGIVAEDKIYVLLTLLLRQISKDMLEANFNKKYLLYIPESLYLKEKKFYHLLKSFDDEYARHSIIILVKYDEASKYSKMIKECIKAGYHFAVDLENVSKIKVKDRGLIEIMDYIFMSRRNKEKDAILASLASDVSSKFIYTDIVSRVGNIWGE